MPHVEYQQGVCPGGSAQRVLCPIVVRHWGMSDSLDPIDYGTPAFPVLLYRPDFLQIHIHWVSDAKPSCHPLSPPSLPALNLSHCRDLFQWVGSSHQVAKVLELQLCPRASSNKTIHTKALVDLVFEDCFRKWQSSENIDSKSNLNGFFNLVDNFSKYYLRWEQGLSELLLNCHSQSGSSCTSQPNTISDLGLELSKFKGNCVLFICSVKIVMSLKWVNGTFVTNNRNWRGRTY